MSVTCILRRLISTNIRQTARKFHCSSIIRDGAYEGDGKTTLSILNRDASYGLMINTYSEVGFRLNNGILIIGPVVLFPKTALSWKISGMNDINEDTLSLFTVLEPKPDVLVIGIGSGQRSRKFDKMIIEFTNKYNINMEVVPTNQACATFNFLNAEGRFVGAGLIPPATVAVTESEIMNNPDNLKVIDSPIGL